MNTYTMTGWVCRGANGKLGVTRRPVGDQIVTNFRFNDPIKKMDGTKKNNYFSVEYWHRPNDPADALIVDGAHLLLTGSLSVNEWQDQGGQTRSEVRLKVQSAGQIEAPQTNAYMPQNYAQAQGYPPAAPENVAPAVQVYEQVYDDEIPF